LISEEFLFGATLVGVGLLLVSWIWLVIRAWKAGWVRGLTSTLVPPLAWLFGVWQFSAHKRPLAVALAGLLLVAAPPAMNRWWPVDLGPRDILVEGERHLTLTGWDRDDYRILQQKSDAVVLQIANPDVTDTTLELVRNLQQLRELDISDSQVSDAGLAILAELPQLERLRLARTGVTDAGFHQHLAKMESLRELDLRGTAVSAELVRAWRQSRPGRRALR
jgi:hypothetical protein